MSVIKDIDRLFETEPGSPSERAARHYGRALRKPVRRQRAFNVYLNGENIDTVFYSSGTNVDADEVKRSLINHDGYDSGITVEEER